MLYKDSVSKKKHNANDKERSIPVSIISQGPSCVESPFCYSRENGILPKIHGSSYYRFLDMCHKF